MNTLRKEIADRIERLIEAFAKDRLANEDYTRSDLAAAMFQSFMDGIVMATRMSDGGPEDLRVIAKAWQEFREGEWPVWEFHALEPVGRHYPRIQ